jgi:hypothetical protein
MDERQKQAPLHDQLKKFEQENPKVVEAMRLFGMSLAEYQGTLNALMPPKVGESHSTTTTKQWLTARND